MPELTRRRETGRHQECWHIYYGDIRVGTIGERAGVPVDLDQWGWACGFYPLSHHGRHFEGTAKTFKIARRHFEIAWKAYLPTCTEEDFREYRRQRDWTAWKYRMFDTGCLLPTQNTSGRSRCFCGAEIDVASTGRHVYEAHASEGIAA